MNAYEKIKDYLANEQGVDIEPADNDDEDNYYDGELHKLLLEYGQEQRKEGYIKGFEDGEESVENSLRSKV